MIDQATIDRVAAAIDSANIDHAIRLIRLEDGIATYIAEINGSTVEFTDNYEAEAIDQAYAHVRAVKQRLQAEAVIAALASEAPPSTHDMGVVSHG